MQSLAAPDVDDVGIRRRHRQRPDGGRGLMVEDRRPGAPVVVGAEDAAVDGSDVEDPGPLRDAARSLGAASAEGTDGAIAQLAEQLVRGRRGESGGGEQQDAGGQGAGHGPRRVERPAQYR